MKPKTKGRAICLALVSLLVLSCGGQADRGGGGAAVDEVTLALAVAQEYVDGYYDQFPEEAYELGYPNPPLDRFSDRSPEALATWHAREDAWLETLQSIDPDSLEGTGAAVPKAFALHQLEAFRDLRICRPELWTVSPTWTGWQDFLPANFNRQAVGSDEARAALLARARDAARFIDTDIANLRLGLSLGYVAPRSGVEATIRATESLLEGAPEDSPFFDPAVRDSTEEFAGSLLSVIENGINPAVSRYLEFLSSEYLPAARDSIAVTDTPGGEACYAAALRLHTSLSLSPKEIHEIGLREMERLHEEMRVIGRRSFGIDEPAELLDHVRSNPAYRFESEEEILDYARTAMERAKEAVPETFGFVPTAEIIVAPFPKFLMRTGGGLQSVGTPDGSIPAKFEIGTFDPTSLGKAEIEALTFHETYPGHHLQTAVAMEKGGLHPVLRYFFFNATGEGWALYTEKLADEMGLYSSELSQIGRLSSEAWRAARLVVDPGMHALGWTRQQAIDYILENTSSSEGEVIYEIDRYIAVPAQAVSYLVGSLEIQHLRRLAEERLGNRFDVRAFHDAVIEDGTVTLEMLQRKIERWIGSEMKR